MIHYKHLPQFSMKNKALLDFSSKAGCYHCCKIFEAKEINQFTDDGQTAICPYCNIDAVVGDSSGFLINEESLNLAKKYWF